MKFTLSAENAPTAVTTEDITAFPWTGDNSGRSNSRLRFIHDNLAGSKVDVQVFLSDGTWRTIHVIEDSLCSVIDSPHRSFYRLIIQSGNYGGTPVDVFIGE